MDISGFQTELIPLLVTCVRVPVRDFCNCTTVVEMINFLFALTHIQA